MKLEEHILLWNHAAVKILDIRHVIMEPGELLESYLLPASSFIYGVRGSATLQLDGNKHDARRFHMLHGGKGMRLDIEAKEEFEYYQLFYKTGYAFTGRKELTQLMERYHPFSLQYAFRPEEPLALLRCLTLMRNIWQGAHSLDQLHIKGLFYQFLHELLRQMDTQGIDARKPDLVSQAIRYIDEHYQKSLTLESIADTLNYSPRHLSMRFKEEKGVSPIHYLIQVRVAHAIELLLGTDADMQEIAREIGYSDVYYFSRIFKKYTGLSPLRFRTSERQRRKIDDYPFNSTRLSIGSGGMRRYIGNDDDNHYQYKRGGSIQMKRHTKPGLAVSILLSLTLLLGACSAGGTNTGNSSSTTANTAAASNAAQNMNGTAGDNNQASKSTRIVPTIIGEIEVPANPKRVVVLYLLGDVVAMGIKPVGVSDVFEGAAFEKDLAGVKMLGSWFEPNPEAIMALEPDLIIVPSEDTYKKLSQIAPTILVPNEKMTTDERLALLGKTFGKEQETQTLLDNFNTKVKESKEKLAAAGVLDKTVTIIEGGKKEMSVVTGKQFGRGSQIIYEYLGMKAPEIIQKKIDGSTNEEGDTVSMEVLPEYIGDYVVRSSYEGMDDLTGNPIWNSIPAVKEGRMIELSFNLSYYSDIYSLDEQLDFIVEQLLATATKN